MHLLERVHCPEDRGSPAYDGRILGIGKTVHTNIHGVRFRWLTVQRLVDQHTKHVWPSNRLGFHIE